MPTQEEIVEVLKTIIDPELYLDIYTLGLIYGIEVKEDIVNITMTFTSVACPAGPYLMEQVKDKILDLDDVEDVNVEVTFDPQWEPSEELKATLGML